MSIEENKALVRRFIEVANQGNVTEVSGKAQKFVFKKYMLRTSD
jgi:hypothetical protein